MRFPDWQSAFEGLPTGFDTDRIERKRLDAIAGRGSSTYGEMNVEGVARLLGWLEPGPDDVLVDLGSGAGRFVFQAACTTDVGRAVGVELSPLRHSIAIRARQRLRDSAAPEARACAARIELRCEDLRETVLSDATLVYAGCFADILPRALAGVVDRTPRLRRLVTTVELAGAFCASVAEIGRLELPMTWAEDVPLHVYGPR